MKVWAEKEMRNLARLRQAGIRAPAPVLLRMHVLVMEFIGEGGTAAPRLKVKMGCVGGCWAGCGGEGQGGSRGCWAGCGGEGQGVSRGVLGWLWGGGPGG